MKGITGNPALDAYHRMAISPVGAARPVARAEQTTATESASTQAAQVSISARARDLATDSAERGVDVQKVDALKQRIAEGSFRVDAQTVASRMIEQLA